MLYSKMYQVLNIFTFFKVRPRLVRRHELNVYDTYIKDMQINMVITRLRLLKLLNQFVNIFLVLIQFNRV